MRHGFGEERGFGEPVATREALGGFSHCSASGDPQWLRGWGSWVPGRALQQGTVPMVRWQHDWWHHAAPHAVAENSCSNQGS